MTWFDRLVDWWWDVRNGWIEPSNVGNEWDEGYPVDMDCPDTQPTSPGALDSDLGRLS